MAVINNCYACVTSISILMKQLIQRQNLDEISFIRPILIILLVAFHAFAPWDGSWPCFDGYQDNGLYWWIAKTTYSFMLPAFVFLSGYVWSYQREFLGRKETLKVLAIKKFKRLIVPSVVFSLAYICLIENTSTGALSLIENIISGTGHMWFLPMLFICFIF